MHIKATDRQYNNQGEKTNNDLQNNAKKSED